ncbi:MAG: deoxyribose-phosphate aldolase [Firmicutes bacterium]|nr:deoxyribose-phosphate aldolase [Bacillota bacterium]
MNKHQIARYIDHTLLKQEASLSEVAKLCREAVEYGFASVCVNPCNVEAASAATAGSQVRVCTVIGFPLGANTTAAKVFEAEDAVRRGAHEVDMVMNIGRFKEKKYEYVQEDIAAVAAAVQGRALLKVIVETGFLDGWEVTRASEIVRDAGADFIKTSTGFSKGGATVQHVQLMRGVLGDQVEIKASGGVRNYEQAVAMIQAGASRIGTSAGIAIVEGAEEV